MASTSSDSEWLNRPLPEIELKACSVIQTALGESLPEMEIRFEDLAITASVVVNEKKAQELPTLWNTLKGDLVGKLTHSNHVIQKEIIKPFSGAFRPGTMTLILGQPSSGKSSLMKVLAGRFPESSTARVEGNVTYNGKTRQDMQKVLPQVVSYMGQRDIHYPILTVGETMAFAHECSGAKTIPETISTLFDKGSPEDNAYAKKVVKELSDLSPALTLKMLGLSHVSNTIVGDQLLRGVSGGERKRVTTGEMKFGMKLIDLMDEISTGLDSAATFDIVSASKRLAKVFRKTIVVSLLQPPPEVLDLFDDVLVLNDGYVLYHGPRTEVLEYFASLGYVCPEGRDVADFLLDLGTPQQSIYLSSELIDAPRTPNEFALCFQNSEIYAASVKYVHGPLDRNHLELDVPQFRQSFWDSTRTVMKRQLLLSIRNTAFIQGRMSMVIIMGILYGLIFYKMDTTLAQVVMGMIFSAMMFIAISQASQVPTFFAQREIFYKQRGANFFRTSSYVLSSSLAQLPFSIVESVVFGSLVYWMTGFVADASAFIIFLCALILANLAFAAWFNFISACLPNLLIAQPFTFVTILFYVLFAGFMMAKDSIPDYLIWIFWINPLMWCFRALSVNQYANAEFQKCEYGGVDYCKRTGMNMGTYQLSLYGFTADRAWIAYGFIYMAAAYVFFMLLTYYFFEYKRYESPEGTNVSLEEASDLGLDASSYAAIKTPNTNTDSVVVAMPPRQVQPVTLTFKDVWYTVKDNDQDKNLLQGISGYARPGTITALMGASGAGKTTLMDVIAGRKTGGTIKGEIKLNGFTATKLAISRVTGYCEQTDQHCESATFREAFEFSAFLRQSSEVSDEDKMASVDECLTLLDMHNLADTIIRGASVEQMKRLTIGVELASNASILFLDEPTSGLDARSALRIMRGLRHIAKSGRTVVCTIHQPSYEVFEMFDQLLLLQRGGLAVYFGPLGTHCSNLIEYMEAVPGTKSIKKGQNPATWMLEVIGAGTATETLTVDYNVVYEQSSIKQLLLTTLEDEASTIQEEMVFRRKRAAKTSVQMKMVIQRFARMYWRTPSYTLTPMFVNMFLAVVFGIIFCRTKYYTFNGLNAGVGIVFMATLFVGMMGFNNVLPLYAEERASFYRERACQTYNALWYFVGSTIIEIPYAIIQVILFTIIFYPFIGLVGVVQCIKFMFYLFLFVLMQIYFGQLLAVGLPSVEVASVIGGLISSIFFLFMGFNPPTSSIPSGLKWINTIVPPKYALSLLVTTSFGKCDNPGDSDLGCQIMEGVPPSILLSSFNNATEVTMKQYVEGMFKMNGDDNAEYVLIVICFLIFFRILGLIAMRYQLTMSRPSETSAVSALEWVLDVTEERYEKIARILEAALGQKMPQMEIRFQDLAITADVTVNTKNTQEIPTVWTALKGIVSGKFKKKNIVRKEVLKPMTGAFRAGTITLVLGQPSSGKSSLMKILSGRFPVAKNVHVDGQIKYNGRPRQELLKVLPQIVGYCGQRDYHYATLTVEETLNFANECCGGKTMQYEVARAFHKGTAADNEQAIESLTFFIENYAKFVMKNLGLSHCAKTIVGDQMLRGVSGGERKRVTTGEMNFGMKLVNLMDEISTGLDSAATFDIVNSSRTLTHKLTKTIVISLLQPPPEVYDLFDDVLVLNEGYVMYHGPREEVLDYFESLGFYCPPRRDVADFLLDLGTDQQHIYETGKVHNLPRTAVEYASCFKQSKYYQNMVKYVEGPVNGNFLEPQFPRYRESFWASTGTVMRRQLKLMLRNTAFLKGRFFMVIIMGVLYGLTFYQMDPTIAQVVVGMIFSSIMFIAIGQASQVNTFYASRSIFYKQRGANFYRTASYVLSTSLAQVPFAIMESLLFGSLVYWLTGFVSDALAFIVFLLALVVANLTFASWFFFISCAAPNLLMAQPLTFLSILFYVLFAGFLVTKDNIPDYCIWIYWINPLGWCFRLLSVNQYSNSQFQVCVYDGVDYCKRTKMNMGTYELSLYGFSSKREWIIYGFIYMAASYFVFMLLSFVFLEFKRYESPESTNVVAEEENAEQDGDESFYKEIPDSPPGYEGRAIDMKPPKVTPVTLAFRDIWYTVYEKNGDEKHLLHGISGYARPGTITALMGSSGAGKTTLMDVIAGRKTGGTIQGRITLNGHPATKLSMSRVTGYCEQTDQHCESATFREALEFSAFLRQSSEISDEDKKASVEECLTLLDMHNLADVIIRGSSVEQMKRLTIGVELASNASILFLDEPTSGLDARAALRIMRGLTQIAKSGRTIVCTIHQPSSEVFEMFDQLLLLKRGGHTVYFGPLGTGSSHLIEYLEAIPGTEPIQRGHNPATWMLEVIGAGTTSSNDNPQDFAKIFDQSSAKSNLVATLVEDDSTVRDEMVFRRKRAAYPSVQMKFVVQRFWRLYWRTPSYTLSRIQVNVFLSILFGLVFVSVNYTTFNGLNGGVGIVFLATLFIGIMGFNSVLPLFVQERNSYYRERACQTYNALWYFIGSTIVEIPYVLVSVIVFVAIFYPFVGFTGATQGIWFTFFLFLYVLTQVYFGQMLACALPSIEVASIIGGLLNSIFFLFMGFNPPTSQIPSGLKWLNTIVPPKYGLALLVSTVFGKCDNPGDSDLGCQPLEGIPPSFLTTRFQNKSTVTLKEYVETMYGMYYADRWVNMIVLIGCMIVFRILGLLAMRYVNHQQR
ncbi:ATP-binding Cassette (ABC) Superfamily [Thraustotheca clavata]|uniref:ATP-binding Cassette (ABC) Superfamily n=1 Tax=Thraustotheca clavata TaxID=74557 RepID=A0A1V9YVQ3_9STRA|nr:ATP-binding Cassette (ABC) Superfamily [Thraustotheca clavata]